VERTTLLTKIPSIIPRLAARSAAYGVPSCYTKGGVLALHAQLRAAATRRRHLPTGCSLSQDHSAEGHSG
jgi:hypothetical protein